MTLAVDLRLIDIKPTAVTVPIPRHMVYTVEFFALRFGQTPTRSIHVGSLLKSSAKGQKKRQRKQSAVILDFTCSNNITIYTKIDS